MDLFNTLEELTWYQDEPFLSTSTFAQWNVFELARDSGVKVILDGQGADEILCGYPGYFGANLAGMVRSGNLNKWCREILLMKRNVNFSYYRSLGYTLAYLFPGALQKIGRLDNRDFSDKTWIHPSSTQIFHKNPHIDLGSRGNSVRGMSMAQTFSTNLPMLLHWEDRNSMAFSVEARVPFLDYRMVEFCIGLSDQEKIHGGVTKDILRRSMRGLVPDLILDRKDKMGFVTAEKLWTTRDMASKFRIKLTEAVDMMPGILNSNIVDQFDQVINGSKQFDFRYWRAISAGAWAKVFDVTF
jgi:asparagine synthase (glutamine-hydrolysing)